MNKEQDLIRRVLAGDQGAFGDLMALHETQVYNLCLRMVGNREDAQDLAQEAFLKAWRGLQFYKAESSFSTWLYRLTTNVCIDFLRAKKRKPVTSLTLAGEEEEEDTELEVPDTAPTTEEQVLHQEDRSAVAKAMDQLEEEFRLVLTLRVVEELSYEEIGEILDLKPGTVRSRIARARTKLKKILLESGNFSFFGTSNQEERGAAP